MAFPDAGDLSMFVAAAIAAIVHLATYRLRPLSKPRRSAEDLDPAVQKASAEVGQPLAVAPQAGK
ncbi:hypothetical protein [Arthrobacter sp. H35-D1]|uniref:hypothetical protein n=1 Tax=Arthrobacter sp. H35-D1 TaxID=3046202 RepID=UPI0024B91843|nr:hypothetical protein [Arthrobacter sp. H35-D1]MDJ0313897.1 hypothetical protein [Arthrobacter sp. H35-D1]